MIDLILSSTTRIFCFIRSKLKLCSLNKLPMTTTVAPTDIKRTFPIRRGVVSPVVAIERWPYSSHAAVIQEQSPQQVQISIPLPLHSYWFSSTTQSGQSERQLDQLGYPLLDIHTAKFFPTASKMMRVNLFLSQNRLL